MEDCFIDQESAAQVETENFDFFHVQVVIGHTVFEKVCSY